MNKLSLLALSLSAFMSTLSFASANFTITTAPGTTLPTTVSKGGTVSAFFSIKNNTHSARTGYTVKGLPSTVKQYSGSSEFCTNPVNLAASAQCILRLDIQGPVKGPFALCHGTSCTTSATALNVTQAAALLQLLIAPGTYIDSQDIKHPLLAQSQDQGTNWTYVQSIQDLKSAYLNGSSCSQSICIASGSISMDHNGGGILTPTPFIVFSADGGTNWNVAPNSNLPTDYQSRGELYFPSCSDNLCVAAGIYRSFADDGTIKNKPLIRVSQDKGQTWSSPASTYQNLPSGFLNGQLASVSCSGQLCIAAGQYGNPGTNHPLLALTTDGGSTWSYPAEIQNTPSNFIGGQFIGASCSGTVCVASAQYNINAARTRPLLIVTQDSGKHWNYPDSIQKNVPIGTARSILSSPACSGKLCIAVGSFSRGNSTLPLLAVSNDRGSNWTYPAQIYNTVPQNSTNAEFISASCDKTLCIAAGYFNSDTQKPMLAVSYDSGATWSYPPAVYNNLPSDYIGNASFRFGANCKDSICTAIGHYDYGSGSSKPLLILSTDSGHTWSYPPQINSLSSLPSNFISGYFSLLEE